MKRDFKLYYTSDTHGAIFPSMENPSGLMQCIAQFKKDGNTLILDGGDTIQGSPLSKYLWEFDRFEEVIPYVFNTAGYDCFIPGNHDFNYGYLGLSSYINSMNASCLAANLVDETGRLPVRPYQVFTLENGLRIGICGIVTDCVNLWESKENMTHLAVTDAFTAAKQSYEAMAKNCDFSICIYHGGFECDLDTGNTLCEGNENIGYRICKELNFDLLLTAHQHMQVEGRSLYGTYTLQVPANAAKYAKVEIAEENGTFMIHSELLKPEQDYDKELFTHLLPVKEKVDQWLSTKVGTLKEAIAPVGLLERAVNGSKLADFCNLIQLNETNADISCTGLSNAVLGLNSTVSLNELLKAFPFANATVVLEVNDEILKKALERCASYFDLIDGEIDISERFTKPKEEHYNYDYYAGVSYKIDLTKPVGSRVSDIIVNGEPLSNRTYRLAMSNYRATGTGGYEFFQKCKVCYVSKNDIQQTMIAYLKDHPELEVPDMGEILFK